jgi:hypothetical protein
MNAYCSPADSYNALYLYAPHRRTDATGNQRVVRVKEDHGCGSDGRPF